MCAPGGIKMPPSRIRFESHESESTFLDPRNDFQQTTTRFEVRIDPLTGRTGHFSHFGAIRPPKLPIDSYRTPEVKGFCPFCPENRERRTPRFADSSPVKGRPAKNEAVLIPNLYPYDIYNGVVIMADDHVVILNQFDARRLGDSLSLGIDFLKSIKSKDPSLPYHVMTWNYMPPSGGGLVHPHQQYFASKYPGNQYMDEFQASERFFEAHGVNYWHEYVSVEERRGERFIGKSGNSYWFASFISFGLLGEILCVFPDVYSVDDFTEDHLDGLVEGLLRVFKYFIQSDIYSFNASLYFGPADQRSFSSHLKIVPRTFLNTRDYASDLNFFQAVLGEPVSVVMPEALCRDVKEFFK
jgi:UDPglucose--hexose-1-phosphate uridylyltransferase